jgi:hypothetical protein
MRFRACSGADAWLTTGAPPLGPRDPSGRWMRRLVGGGPRVPGFWATDVTAD